MAFVLVQHLAPKHESALTELLGRATEIPVTEVKDGMAVAPDRVYVIPPNATMAILDGRLRLMPRTTTQKHLPIDSFLHSLAEECGSKAIGVILSGTASDGTLGMKAIKTEGGITFAQDEQSARYADMPRHAIAGGCVDFVLPPQGIARELIRIAQHPYIQQAHAVETSESAGKGENELKKILILLRTATGVDFTDYKQSTIQRRINRRMMLHKTKDLRDYLKYLRENPPEVKRLYHDILIHVTGFFRDPEAFEALKTKVFRKLLKNRPAGLQLRVWVPGCSTGEEAYSIAICLLECFGNGANSVDIQIFATDISETALEKARAGIYTESIAADVSPERLRRFFVKAPRAYQISKSIRDICVFARQDIIKDPPFSGLDLISCRNLLIYLGTVLQKKVLPVIHYALKPNGYLLLGSSETLGSFADHFDQVDKKHKIYVKKFAPTRLGVDFSREDRAPEEAAASKEREEPGASFDLQKEADRILLEKYVPAGVVVNADLEILNFRGRTGDYLEPAPGQASLSLTRMAREGLLVEVRQAIQKAKQEDAPVKKQAISIRRNGGPRDVDIEVVPIKSPSPAERYFLVLFQEMAAARPEPSTASGKGAASPRTRPRAVEHQVIQLKEELAGTKANLQSIIEEQETTSEELKSVNEEILSSNEELQSTNEELETAKEELQSTNEELTTLNEELQNRNVELHVVNNDLLNLLASVNVPILMLGNDLRIRRATPLAEKMLNLIHTDVGRPVSDIKSNLNFPNLDQAISEAIDTVSVKEYDVQDQQGRWYSMRIRPYKTTDNKIDGAVITWFDVSTMKANLEGSEKALSEAEERYRLLIERNLAGVFRKKFRGPFLECNSAFAEIFGYDSPADLLSHPSPDLYFTTASGDHIFDRLKEENKPINIELHMRRRDGRPVWILMNAVLVRPEGNGEPVVEGIVLDITARREAENSPSQLSARLIELQDTERKRISRELHDTTGQSLAALAANLAVVNRSASALDKKARHALTESLDLARQCSREIRTVSYLLHPPLLDEMGLASALRWYAEGFAKRSGVRVDLDLPPEVGRLPQELETALFRIVQESLTNIHLHSRSPTARIRLIRADNELSLEVKDNGKGLPTSGRGVSSGRGEGLVGVGVAGMRERVNQLGGRFDIISGSDGTTVRAVLPLAKA
jgi:two-component system, chemotaxis family, CheB/CheR fusion protein